MIKDLLLLGRAIRKENIRTDDSDTIFWAVGEIRRLNRIIKAQKETISVLEKLVEKLKIS